MSTRETANPIPSGHCQPGARNLQVFAMRTFGLADLGCYNPNSHLSGGGPSWHVHGEAIDLGCNWNDPTARGRGNAWFAWLVAHREELNLQQAIWGNTIYDVSYGLRAYTHHDHENHIHAALGHAAAANWHEGANVPITPPKPPPPPTKEDQVESAWYGNGMHTFWIDKNGELQHNYGNTFVENMTTKYKMAKSDRAIPVSVTTPPNGALYVRTVGVHGELLLLNFDSVHGWGKDTKLPVA